MVFCRRLSRVKVSASHGTSSQLSSISIGRAQGRFSRISDFKLQSKFRLFLLLTLAGLLTSCSWIYGSIVRTEFNSRTPGSESCPTTTTGAGTQADPYLITCEAQFKKLGESPSLWSSSIALTKDLDLSGVQLSPIGNAETPFMGKFDGRGFRLKNISMSTDSIESFGVFGWARTAEITNLKIVNISINSNASTNSRVGGLLGFAEDQIQISNIQVSGSITGGYAGGIIGFHQDNDSSGKGTGMSLKLTNLTNTSNVSGISSGGILGSGWGSCGSSSGLNNSGTVSGGSMAGGIAGALRTRSGAWDWCSNSGAFFIANCSNSGNINGAISGGLVGELYYPIYDSTPHFSKCANTGNISGFSWVGGLVGNFMASISESFSSGAVAGDPGLAFGALGGAFGLFGYGSSARGDRVYSSGNVSGGGTPDIPYSRCGSFAGMHGLNNSLTNSFTTGSVNCHSSLGAVGRFAGEYVAVGGTLSNFYYNSASSCTNPSGSCVSPPAGTTAINLATSPNYFKTITNAPLNSWNFTTIWQTGSGAFPILR